MLPGITPQVFPRLRKKVEQSTKHRVPQPSSPQEQDLGHNG